MLKLNNRTYRDEVAAEGSIDGSNELSSVDRITKALNGESNVQTDSGENGETKGGTENAPEELSKVENNHTSEAEARLLKEVMKRKQNEKVLADEIASLKAKFDVLGDTNLDDIKLLLDSKKESEQKKLEAKGEWDALKKQMKEGQDKVVKAMSETISELKAQLSEKVSIVDKLTLGSAFEGSKFINGELALPASKVKVLYGDYFEVQDDTVVGYDKPKSAANRSPLVNAEGEFLAFEDAIKKIIDVDPDKDSLTRSKAKQGAGSQTANVKPSFQPQQLSSIDKILSGLSNKS